MKDLSNDNQASIIKALNSIFLYLFQYFHCFSITFFLDDLFNIDTPYFEGMVNQFYPSELQLNKVKT